MNDRTRWDDPRQERGGDDYRQGSQQSQQDWNRQGSGGQYSDRDRYGSQSGGQQNWRQQQQDWGRQSGRQHGGWSDDDDWRRQGSYRGNEWRGERDWGSPSYGYSGTQGQPQQREWRSSSQDRGMGSGSDRYGSGEYNQGDYGYAERAWGGSSERYGSRPTSSGSMHRDEVGESTRMRQDREMRERQDMGSRDVGARGERDWYQRDNSRRAGSQSFSSAYGMEDGANYDQWGHSGTSNPTYGRGYGPDYLHQDQENRGFFARAGDEIASWFGDEDAARRREQDYRGHGPSDYTRSDERIREDVNDKLTDDPRVDARKISVKVDKGEVTLSGTVSSREAKRRAEDAVDRISGVKHVQNNLRVEERSQSGTSSPWGSGLTSSYDATRETGGAPGGSSASGMGATGSTSGASGSSSSSGLTGTSGTAGSSGTTGSSGATGSSASGSTTPTTGGTSSQGASTGTMGSSGSSSGTSGSSSGTKSS